MRPDSYRAAAPTLGRDQYGDVRDGEAQGQFHLVWPALKFNVMPAEHGNLSIGPMWPASPSRTDGFLDYFFAPEASEEWIAAFLELDDQVGAEDAVLVASVQRGMASGVFEDGRLLLPGEELIAAFQAWVSAGVSPRA